MLRNQAMAESGRAPNAADDAEADSLGPNSIEHGSARHLISDESFSAMAKQGIYFDPTLSVVEAFSKMAKRAPPLVTGTDSGNFLLLHGPALHRELQLLIQAGATPLLAAIRPGYDATLLLVDGNPSKTFPTPSKFR